MVEWKEWPGNTNLKLGEVGTQSKELLTDEAFFISKKCSPIAHTAQNLCVRTTAMLNLIKSSRRS